MVEVHVVPAAFRELPGGQQQLDEQLVEFLRRVEVIDVAGLFAVYDMFSVASSSMPRSTVSALGTRVCGRSVRTSFRYRLRSSIQSPPQQNTEKMARIISLY